MMYLRFKYFLLVVALVCPLPGYSGVVNVVGTITQIKMFPVQGGGAVVLYMDELQPACAEGNPGRVLISTDHPLFNAVLSTALAAKTTKDLVEIGYVDQCSTLSNAWDFQHFLIR